MSKTTAVITAAALSLPLLALAACGSQTAPHAAITPSAPAAQVKATPAGPQGFQVPSNLQKSLRRQMNKKARKAGYSLRVTSVTCVEQSRQKATCLAEFSDDVPASTIHVVISADGMTFVSS
jgi:outer membrane lipopolysaccharide assembly protein LptE/RlpB